MEARARFSLGALLAAGWLTAATAIAVPSPVATPDAAGAEAVVQPFADLLSTSAGQTVLDNNLATAFAIQNNTAANPYIAAMRNQAMLDNERDLDRASTLANGLGDRFANVYWSAITTMDPDSHDNPVGYATSLFKSSLKETTDANASSVKDYYGSNFNTYGTAYVPSGDPQPNPKGDPRPFQVGPLQTPPYTTTNFSAPTFVVPSYGSSSYGPVGPSQTNHYVLYEAPNSEGVAVGLQDSPSFVSGHSSYAYSGSVMLAIMMPELFQQQMLRGSEFANGRLVMGAHYPLDVIGARAVALYSIATWLQNEDNQGFLLDTGGARDQFRSLLADGVGGALGFDAEVAAQQGGFHDVTTGPEAISLEAARALFDERMDYGLVDTNTTGLAPVVPEGAEVLLITRFPYLLSQQRRDVLATTEHASGIPLDAIGTEYEGWVRLNLFAAAGGYGSLDADTTVTMDASQGGFFARDTWNNNIGGTGTLIKEGTGMLILSGHNTFAGVEANGGHLVLTGINDFSGSSTVGSGGVLTVESGGGLNAADDITVNSGGILSLAADRDGVVNAGTDGSGNFTNNGTVHLYAGGGAGRDEAVFTPITVGADTGAFAGTNYVGFGGTWNNTAHTFTVSAVHEVAVNMSTHTGSVSSLDVSGGRLGFDFTGNGQDDLVAGFGSAGTIDFAATQLELASIENSLVLGAYDFATDLAGDTTVLLSYYVGEDLAENSLLIWHLGDGASEWDLYHPTFASYADGWYSFTVTSFSSYAVTVPEPGTGALLAMACLSLIFVRRRSG